MKRYKDKYPYIENLCEEYRALLEGVKEVEDSVVTKTLFKVWDKEFNEYIEWDHKYYRLSPEYITDYVDEFKNDVEDYLHTMHPGYYTNYDVSTDISNGDVIIYFKQ